VSTIAYFFTARFAGVDLEIATWTESIGRTVVQHEPSRGDGAELSDRGRVPRTYELSIRLTGTAVEVADKRATLVAIAANGDTRVFEHPLDGVIRCKLTDFNHTVGPGDVSAQITLIEDLAFSRRFPQDETPDLGTFPEVQIRASEASEAISGLASLPTATTPDFAAATNKAATWRDRAQSDVAQDVEAMRGSSRGLVRELDRTNDVDAYQASLALEAFRGAYEQYARTVNRGRGATFTLTVARPLPMIVLLSRIYGATRAESLESDILRINDVRDATRVESGKILTLPVVAA